MRRLRSVPPIREAKSLTMEQAMRLYGPPPNLALRLKMDLRHLLRPFTREITVTDPQPRLTVTIGGVEIGYLMIESVESQFVGMHGGELTFDTVVIPMTGFDGTELLEAFYGKSQDDNDPEKSEG